MATTGDVSKKQKTDRTDQMALLMTHFNMSREAVDELNNTQWTCMLSAASQFEQLQKEIEQKDKVIEQLRKENEHKDSRLGHFDTTSLRRLLNSPPSVDFHSNGNLHSHTASTAKHGKATPLRREAKIELQEVNVRDEVLDSTSRLLQDLIDNDTLRNDGQKLNVFYTNEADVSSYVSAALKDAVKLVNESTRTRLSLRHELSLWSNRPDHVVVWNETSNTPIIAIEDKKPMEEMIDGSFPPEPVIGQIFDYLMELRCFGQVAPFVMLSTLTSSWIFWENNEETNNLVLTKNNVGKWKELIRSPPQNILLGPTSSQKTLSPPELIQETFAPTNSNFSTFDSRRFDRNKTVIQSEKFDISQLVRLFYTGIICSLVRNFDTAPLDQKNRTCWQGLALHLTEKSYKWGQLDLKAGESVQLATKRASRKKPAIAGSFFAVGLLGYGQTSKVFDAYDHLGQRRAVKMYVQHFRGEDGKLLSKKKSQKKGEKLCRLEVGRLKDFYPELADKVSMETLNGFPCVIMPIFQPLTKRERTECIDKIRACLKNFVDKNDIQWKYQDEDLRWRHVGVYEDENEERKIIMYDLADLVELEKLEGDVFESRDPHVTTLMGRLNG